MSDAEQPKSGNALDTLREELKFAEDEGLLPDQYERAAAALARVEKVIEAARALRDARRLVQTPVTEERALDAALRAVDEGEAP